MKADELIGNTRSTYKDEEGVFVKLPKCNFDVEMTVDSIRLMDSFDTLAMFSSDSDFVALFRYLRNKGKKVIMIKGGNVTSELRNNCDLVVSAKSLKSIFHM